MPFNNLIDRTDAGALIPEEVTREIFQGVAEQSAVMRLARRLPNMSRKQLRMPVASALVDAYFVNGDTGLKQTTEAAWSNKFINAAEIAAIVPIPEQVLDDLDYDIWDEVRPRLIEAIGRTFDKAVLYGTNAPSDWPTAIVTGATNAGHSVSAAATTGVDLYDDIFGEAGTLAFVEQDGYMVTGHVGSLSMYAKMRGNRSADGVPLLFENIVGQTPNYSIMGAPIVFPRNGAIDPAQSLLISGDWSQLVWSVRTDLTWKIVTEGVVTDAAGQIIFNLWQQDMVAMRVTFRAGWQLPNPVNPINATEATRYPFAVYKP